MNTQTKTAQHTPGTEERYENPITPSDTILFCLKQSRGNIINEAEYLEAKKHYEQLRDTGPELLEALKELEAAALKVRHDPFTTCACAEQLALASNSARSAIARCEASQG